MKAPPAKTTFGAAEALVRANIRPRVFFGPDDVERIRSSKRSPVGARLWKAFEARSRWLTDLVMESKDLPLSLADWATARGGDGSWIVRGFWEIAGLYALTGDRRALEASRRVLVAASRMGRHGKVAEKPRVSFAYAVGFHLGPGFDMVADELSVKERGDFVRWAGREVIAKGLNALDPGFFFAPAGNIAFSRLKSVFMMWMCLRGEPSAGFRPEWEARLIDLMEAAISATFGPEGYPYEDIGYGTHAGSLMGVLVSTAARLGVRDLMANQPHFAGFGRAILHFVQPWGEFLSNTGDHGSDFRDREMVLPYLAAHTGDPTLLWLWQTLSYEHCLRKPTATNLFNREAAVGRGRQVQATLLSVLNAPLLQEGRRPTARTVPLVFHDRRRGIVSLRSGWKPDDTFLVFDGAQRRTVGKGHEHASGGHFSLSALGDYFAVDSGRYNMAQSCHNLLLREGSEDQENKEWRFVPRGGLLMEVAPGSFVDTATADNTALHPADINQSRRRIGLVRGDGIPAYVWIQDEMDAGNIRQRFQWLLHTAPENRVRTHSRGATIAGFRSGNRLAVSLWLPSSQGNGHRGEAHAVTGSEVEEVYPSALNYVKQGFGGDDWVGKAVSQFNRPADMVQGPLYVRPRLKVSFEGWNGRCLALLLPVAAEGTIPKVRQIASLPGNIALSIAFPEFTDTIVVSFAHDLLRTSTVEERGYWCVARHRRSDGKCLRRAVGTEPL